MRVIPLRVAAFACATLLVCSTTVAQGSDACATAQPISGNGVFAFDTTAATVEVHGQSESLCLAFGSTAVDHDVWFTWTAPTSGTFVLSTCALENVDSKVAVYAGAACPASGSALACSDDACATMSRAVFAATAGSSYTLQIGTFPGAPGTAGSFALSIAPPPPVCGPNTGPDLIVGTVMDVLNVAASGGIDAIALGTDACNIGTAPVSWVGSTPAHPVIRQNAYRYKVIGGAGRFEQLGASWLKHAFAAINGSTCCACAGTMPGALNVGCSDPYVAPMNGSQGNAGPNWQVNASSGVFPYPPANPTWSGGVARRCQMRTSELETTGLPGAARYFGECQYVNADDAQAGNDDNNASWREMTNNTGADASFQLVGSTHRGESAIRAWPAIEAGVKLCDVRVPGDGLVVVGSKATDLGGGTWHYQYAVHNMNSDRNVGAFSVPVGSAAITNVGFHDIDYHDGDGPGNLTFSGADWTATSSAGVLTWACETQAANTWANAIRWGTLYTFHFDADAPPTRASVSFELWKPGTPASRPATGYVPGASAFESFCFGDGSSIGCPCANNGARGNGCASSGFAAGANLSALGSASVSSDTVELVASNLTGAIAIFFQGASQLPPAIVDDGLGCVGGPVVRLGNNPVGGGDAVYPDFGDLHVSVRGGVPAAGGTFFYQCFYRNAAAAFCPPATSNRTNGVAIHWAP
jgi:hypothetical protein